MIKILACVWGITTLQQYVAPIPNEHSISTLSGQHKIEVQSKEHMSDNFFFSEIIQLPPFDHYLLTGSLSLKLAEYIPKYDHRTKIMETYSNLV